MDAAIDGVHVADTPSGQVPVVLVGVAETTDVLPIFVAFEEALAIRRGLDAEDPPPGRSLTTSCSTPSRNSAAASRRSR